MIFRNGLAMVQLNRYEFYMVDRIKWTQLQQFIFNLEFMLDSPP